MSGQFVFINVKQTYQHDDQTSMHFRNMHLLNMFIFYTYMSWTDVFEMLPRLVLDSVAIDIGQYIWS